MKTYLLTNMTEESFKEINEFLDDIETNFTGAQIYINSGGGSVWIAESILTRLHELYEAWINVQLRACFMASSAFDFFYRYKWPKMLEVEVDAIVHVTATEIHSFNIWGKIRVRSNDMVERVRFRESKNEYHYDFLTEKELLDFNNGDDVYLNYTRLQEIFK